MIKKRYYIFAILFLMVGLLSLSLVFGLSDPNGKVEHVVFNMFAALFDICLMFFGILTVYIFTGVASIRANVYKMLRYINSYLIFAPMEEDAENIIDEFYDKFTTIRDNALDMRMSVILLERIDCVNSNFSRAQSAINMFNRHKNSQTEISSNNFGGCNTDSHEWYLHFCSPKIDQLRESFKNLKEIYKPTLYGKLSSWFHKMTRHPIRTTKTALLNWFDWVKNLVIATIKIVLESEPSYLSNKRCNHCIHEHKEKE